MPAGPPPFVQYEYVGGHGFMATAGRGVAAAINASPTAAREAKSRLVRRCTIHLRQVRVTRDCPMTERFYFRSCDGAAAMGIHILILRYRGAGCSHPPRRSLRNSCGVAEA